MKEVILFDIDGTLADLRHRLHHIKKGEEDYTAFFDAMVDDAPIKPVLELAHHLSVSKDIIFVSGRPDSHRQQTTEWLVKHCFHGFSLKPRLYMRKAGDHRPDYIVKLEILNQIRADGWNPILVIDDRPSVVTMWRKQGLVCLQNEWNDDGFDHIKHQGKTLLTLMVGPSGAGKSTLANHHYPSHVISSDQLRQDLCGDFRDQSKNREVFTAVHDLARTRLKHGLPTVIDATHLKEKDRLRSVALAPKGTRVRYIVVDRPLKEKLRDAGWRSDVKVKGVPLVEYHHHSFKSQKMGILCGDGIDHVDVVDMTR